MLEPATVADGWPGWGASDPLGGPVGAGSLPASSSPLPSQWLMRKASHSLTASFPVSARLRPRTRAAMASRSSRPSGIRAVHQASPLVVAKISSSPPRTPPERNRVSAVRTVSWRDGARLMSSTSSTNELAAARAAPTLVAIGPGGGLAGAGASAAPGSKASKLTMACGLPSSESAKSGAVSPRTGRPRSSSTTASTVTSSVRDENVGTSRRSCALTIAATSDSATKSLDGIYG